MKKNLLLTIMGLVFFSTSSFAQALSVDELLSSADVSKGKTVTVEGVCSHICSHGGKKIFLAGKKPNASLRVESSKQTGAFPTETVGKRVQVTGVVVESRIDKSYLDQWEVQVKNQAKNKKDEHEGCSAEAKAQGEKVTNNTQERIDAFRKRIAEREEKEKKSYLSFYHIEAQSYKIIK